MAGTINFSQVEALQDYVRTYNQQLWTKLVYGFKTAGFANILTGIKGEEILTNLVIGEDLAKRYTGTFEGKDDKATPVPRKITTHLNKIEWQFEPTKWEQNYLGMYRRPGQEVYDMPFEGYILQQLYNKVLMEFENAVWQAIEAAVPSNDDVLKATFDGLFKHIADAILAGLAPVVTGVTTLANILDKIDEMWEAVDIAYKEAGIMTFMMNYTQYDLYRKAYKEKFHQSPETKPLAGTSYKGVVYPYGGGNVMIIPVPGFGTSNRIVCTPKDNLVLGFDGVENLNWKFQPRHYKIDIFAVFRMGTQIRSTDPGVLVVNDQE